MRYRSNLRRSAGESYKYRPLDEVTVANGGLPCILTDHARQSASRREFNNRQLRLFFDAVSMWVRNESFKPNYHNEEVFLWFPFLQRGCVVAFRHDFKGDVKGLCAVLMTVYPYGKAVPMKDSTRRFII